MRSTSKNNATRTHLLASHHRKACPIQLLSSKACCRGGRGKRKLDGGGERRTPRCLLETGGVLLSVSWDLDPVVKASVGNGGHGSIRGSRCSGHGGSGRCGLVVATGARERDEHSVGAEASENHLVVVRQHSTQLRLSTFVSHLSVGAKVAPGGAGSHLGGAAEESGHFFFVGLLLCFFLAESKGNRTKQMLAEEDGKRRQRHTTNTRAHTHRQRAAGGQRAAGSRRPTNKQTPRTEPRTKHTSRRKKKKGRSTEPRTKHTQKKRRKKRRART